MTTGAVAIPLPLGGSSQPHRRQWRGRSKTRCESSPKATSNLADCRPGSTGPMGFLPNWNGGSYGLRDQGGCHADHQGGSVSRREQLDDRRVREPEFRDGSLSRSSPRRARSNSAIQISSSCLGRCREHAICPLKIQRTGMFSNLGDFTMTISPCMFLLGAKSPSSLRPGASTGQNACYCSGQFGMFSTGAKALS